MKSSFEIRKRYTLFEDGLGLKTEIHIQRAIEKDHPCLCLNLVKFRNGEKTLKQGVSYLSYEDFQSIVHFGTTGKICSFPHGAYKLTKRLHFKALRDGGMVISADLDDAFEDKMEIRFSRIELNKLLDLAFDILADYLQEVKLIFDMFPAKNFLV